MSGTTDPVVQLAHELARAERSNVELDEQWLAAEGGRKERVYDQLAATRDQRDALQALITTMRATTLGGAMAQAVIAGGLAHVLADNYCDREGYAFGGEAHRRDAAAILALMLSILLVLEEHCDAKRSDFAAGYYGMLEEQNQPSEAA